MTDDVGVGETDEDEDRALPGGTRRGRLRGLVSVAGGRVGHRLRSRDGQTLLSIGGVGVAVALLLVVTSISAGIVAGATVGAEGADYWIVPEGDASSAVVSVEGQRLGNSHRAAARLLDRRGVTGATPVLSAALKFRGVGASPDDDEDARYLLVLGVVPADGDDDPRVGGLPTTALTDGDPYYANGSYNGTWTGETVLSTAAADALSAGDGRLARGGTLRLQSGGDRAPGTRDAPFTVTAVESVTGPGLGQLPVAVVHLSELQQLTGGTGGDVADQLLVSTDGSVESDRLRVYPNVQVLDRTELLVSQARSSGLPLAMAVGALVVAGVVGLLFLVTTVGFVVVGDAQSRAVLSALGFSGSSLAALVGLETLTVAVVGGVVGVGLWLVSGGLVLAAEFLGTTVPFVTRPVFGVYGLAVAVVIGLLALPPLVLASRRAGGVSEVLR
jgi:putative ABC transport system permease protein